MKVDYLIEENYDQIIQDLATVTPEQRLRFWIDLLEFILPKQQRTTLAGDRQNPLFDEDLTGSLNDLFNRKIEELEQTSG